MPARTLIATVVFTAAVTAAPVKLTDEQTAEFDRLWDACRGNAGDRAHLYLQLIADPTPATEYLTAKLLPMALTEEEGKKLLADLDSEDEKVWKLAYRSLTVRDIRLALPLKQAWELASGERHRRRFGGLLFGYAGPDDIPAQGVRYELAEFGKTTDMLSVGETRDRREVGRAVLVFAGYADEMKVKSHFPPTVRAGIAVAALERIGIPAAKKHLRALANGHEAGPATVAAKAALERLKADPPKPTPPADLWKSEDKGSWERNHEAWGRPEVLNQLLAQPKETVAFLKDKLKPLTLAEKEAKALLSKLFSDDAKVWKAALAEMETFDPRLAMSATDASKLADSRSAEMRLTAVLSGIPRAAEVNVSIVAAVCWLGADTLDDPLLNNRWQREEAAVRVLDAIGTDDALAVVKAMATGHKDAGPTKVAKEVLKRRGVK
jgi:hypothetical protein